jgi:aspartyl-tRNA(Asn)/glutamyl-tRNA(Gln) amidotransferase subunit A
MTQIWQLNAQQLSDAYLNKELSPSEATAAIIERCQSHAEPLNAISHRLYDEALTAAKQADQRYLQGEPLSALDGVPCTIKENVVTQGVNNTMGSTVAANAPVSEVTAPAAERLLAGGAILVAKTAMTDWGLAGSGASTLHGSCKNPHNPELNTNGSSSGSGAALAVGAAPISIGTDLCGSIRNPAAWCGVVGFKQNYGSIPHLPAAWGRHAGPMSRTVADARSMFNLLRGPHPADATSLPTQANASLPQDLKGLKVGLIVNAHGLPAVDAAIADNILHCAQLFMQAGAEIIDLSDQPVWSESMDIWHYYLGLTGSLAMDQFNDQQRQQLPPSMLAFNEISGPKTAMDASRAVYNLDRARQAMHQASLQVDVLLSPTIPCTPFDVDLYGINNDPTRHTEHLRYTGIYNLSGQPAISIPGGFDDKGMPIGVQLATNLYEDDKLLWIAEQLEAMLTYDGNRLLL